MSRAHTGSFTLPCPLFQCGGHPVPGAAEPDPEHTVPLQQPDEVLPVIPGGSQLPWAQVGPGPVGACSQL